MDQLAGKVSVFVCEVKKAILPKFYNSLQSHSGHNCMRKTGPIIAAGFYATQFLHAFLFYTVFGPALHEHFAEMPAVAYIIEVLGWLLCLKVTYMYYRVNTSTPGVPNKIFGQKRSKLNKTKGNQQKEPKCQITTDKEKLDINQDIIQRYSPDVAEILRYSPIAENDFETFENAMGQLPESENAFCTKCKFVKPLRTHHCSVCNCCVLLMDHHCMWTNNCIGLHNYKQFIQLCGFGQFAAFFTVLIILICEKEAAVASSDWRNFFYFCKMWDLLVGKCMMAFFGWNCYVAFSGLSYLEYKNMLETRAKILNFRANGKLEPQGVENQDNKTRVLLKFNYGFGTRHENICRVLKTDNYVLGFLFSDWFEDPRLSFNGTEWSSFYYYNEICKVSDSNYSREEYDRAVNEQIEDMT